MNRFEPGAFKSSFAAANSYTFTAYQNKGVSASPSQNGRASAPPSPAPIAENSLFEKLFVFRDHDLDPADVKLSQVPTISRVIISRVPQRLFGSGSLARREFHQPTRPAQDPGMVHAGGNVTCAVHYGEAKGFHRLDRKKIYRLKSQRRRVAAGWTRRSRSPAPLAEGDAISMSRLSRR